MASSLYASRAAALSGCALFLSLLLPLRSAEVCGSPGSESCPRRQTVDKTPTPCLETYSQDHVQSAADAHIADIKGGHEVPHLLLLFGGSGAGKGTFIRLLEKKGGMNRSDFAFHGLDEYLVYLPEFQKTVNDPSAVYKDAADACYGGGAIPIAKAVQNNIIAGRLHTIYEETGKNLDRVLKRVIPPFEEAGFRITLVLVDNHVGIAQSRAEARFLKEGRYAAPDYIEGSFNKVPENYRKLREMGKVHEAVYCDNSCMGDGTKFEDALPMSGCLQCWRDVAETPEGNLRAGAVLIPEAALAPGYPRYFNGAAR